MTDDVLPTAIRTYDTQADAYCVEWEMGGEVVFALRADDPTERASLPGRGIRLCIGTVEMPLEWVRGEIDAAVPWLTGESDR